MFKLDSIDYGRRVAMERSLEHAKNANTFAPSSNVIFDDSSNFIIYPTIVGIKGTLHFCVCSHINLMCFFVVINLVTNKLSIFIGKTETNERFLRLSLYQGNASSKSGSSAAAQRGMYTFIVYCVYFNACL